MAIKSKRGGKRPNSGRKKGTPNKSTFELKQAASKYGEEALNKLMEIMRDSETPVNIAVTACKEILDRGYGKPAITLEATEVNFNVFPPRAVLDAIYKESLAEAEKLHQKLIVGRRERLGIKEYDYGEAE